MPASVVATDAVTSTGVQDSTDVPVPAHLADDVLVLMICQNQTAGVTTTPAGWAALPKPDSAANITSATFWRRASVGAGAGSVNVVHSGSRRTSAVSAVVRDAEDPYSAQDSSGTSAGDPAFAPATTITGDDTLLIAVLGYRNGGDTWTLLNSWAELDAADGGGTNTGARIAEAPALVDAGAFPETDVWEPTGTNTYDLWLIALESSVGGPAVVEGAATGAFGFSGPAAGTVTVWGAATGSFGFAAPASGTRTTAGEATGVFGFTAPAAGAVVVSGSATGAFGFDAPAAGTSTAEGEGSATGVFGFSAPAEGTVTVSGAATGTFGFDAPAGGTRVVLGDGTASFGFDAPASSTVTVNGQATGEFGFEAPAEGTVTAAPGTGTATGLFGFSAPADGVRATNGTTTGAFGFAGPAEGLVTVNGTASGEFGFDAPSEGVGAGTIAGSATGIFGFAAPATTLVNLVDPTRRTTAVWTPATRGTATAWAGVARGLALLLEDGGTLLLEDGAVLLLEDEAVVDNAPTLGAAWSRTSRATTLEVTT